MASRNVTVVGRWFTEPRGFDPRNPSLP